MQDNSTTIEEIRQKIREYRQARDWEGEDPKDIALSTVLEVAELLEHFQFKTGEEVLEEARLFGPICDELADVLWWVVVMSDRLNIDLSQAFERKLQKNEVKYPAEIFGGDKTPEEKRRAYYKIKASYRGSHPLAEESSDSDTSK